MEGMLCIQSFLFLYVKEVRLANRRLPSLYLFSNRSL